MASLKINFKSHVLPKEIKIFYVVNKVELFLTKPLICMKCLNYGHPKKYCRTEEVCNICTVHKPNMMKTKNVNFNVSSVNASFEHKMADFNCPEYKN